MSKETLEITVLRPTFLKGTPMEVGKTKTLSKKDALDLIAAGKAKETVKITRADKKAAEEIERKLKAGKKAKEEKHASEIAKIPTVNSGRDVKPAKIKTAASSEEDGKALAANKAEEARLKARHEKLVKHTKKELVAMLDEKKISYETDANKDALVSLLIEAEELSAE